MLTVGHQFEPRLPVAPLWCDLGRCSRTGVVIKLRRTSALPSPRLATGPGPTAGIFNSAAFATITRDVMHSLRQDSQRGKLNCNAKVSHLPRMRAGRNAQYAWPQRMELYTFCEAPGPVYIATSHWQLRLTARGREVNGLA